jgi:hypothetical protein
MHKMGCWLYHSSIGFYLGGALQQFCIKTNNHLPCMSERFKDEKKAETGGAISLTT